MTDSIKDVEESVGNTTGLHATQKRITLFSYC